MTILGQPALPAARADAGLPADLAFLPAIGVPASRLSVARALSEEIGVPPHEVLIRTGLLDEETYLRALAARLGLPFLEDGSLLDPVVRFPASVLYGLVRLRPNPTGALLGLAPGPQDVMRLLTLGHLPGPLAILTPSTLLAGVIAAAPGAVAHLAANDLPDRLPALSFRGGLTMEQRSALILALATLASTCALVPDGADLVLAGAGLILMGLIVLRLSGLLEPAPLSPSPFERWPDADLPVYTVIVPLFDEEPVLRRLTQALLALDYPHAKLDIKLVLEEDDERTRSALAAIPLPGCFEILVAPPGEPRTKPRALNLALHLARGEFTVVYDAEDVPASDQLRAAVATFAQAAPEVVCLQARLAIDNTGDGWLARCFALEYAALFDVINPGLVAAHLPVPLGGTSNHLRTEALRDLGGWDAWNVTEDADLGLRIARAGLRVGDLPSTTYEEAPVSVGAWLKQRTRWMKGFVQVAITHSRRPLQTVRELGAFSTASALAMTAGTVLTALAYPVLTLVGVFSLVLDGLLLQDATLARIFAYTVGLVALVGGFAAMLLPALFGLGRRGWWDLLPSVPLLPVYYALIGVAAWRALWELWRAPSHWHKTEHGLARSSRSGLVRDGGAAPPRPRPAAGPS